MERISYLELCRKYGVGPDFSPKSESYIRQKIEETDFFICDDKCIHRMIGISSGIRTNGGLRISAIFSRNDMPLVKKLLLGTRSNKRIHYDSKASGVFFYRYRVGQRIYSDDAPLYVKYLSIFFGDYFLKRQFLRVSF